MRCEEVEHEIPEYLAGTLPAPSLLAEHLTTCARCRNEDDPELRNGDTRVDLAGSHCVPLARPRW